MHGRIIGNADAVAEEIGKIKETYGKIDILINNAGMSDSKPITDYTSDHFEKIMKLNVGAAMNCIMPTVKIMKEQGGGCILNTSSMVSICGQPSGVAYPVSKSAVNGMTWSLARELGPSNIRVNAVAPGITKTDMVAALPKEMIEPLINAIPMRRVGEPEDIANAFLFLASDMASYVTGEILSVDGAMRTSKKNTGKETPLSRFLSLISLCYPASRASILSSKFSASSGSLPVILIKFVICVVSISTAFSICSSVISAF